MNAFLFNIYLGNDLGLLRDVYNKRELIGSGTDVGTEDVIIWTMTIDILRAAPQNCSCGVSFALVHDTT